MAPYCTIEKIIQLIVKTQLLWHNQLKALSHLNYTVLTSDVNVIYLVFKQDTLDFSSFLNVK